jgi:hypothetical protein
LTPRTCKELSTPRIDIFFRWTTLFCYNSSLSFFFILSRRVLVCTWHAYFNSGRKENMKKRRRKIVLFRGKCAPRSFITVYEVDLWDCKPKANPYHSVSHPHTSVTRRSIRGASASGCHRARPRRRRGRELHPQLLEQLLHVRRRRGRRLHLHRRVVAAHVRPLVRANFEKPRNHTAGWKPDAFTSYTSWQ